MLEKIKIENGFNWLNLTTKFTKPGKCYTMAWSDDAKEDLVKQMDLELDISFRTKEISNKDVKFLKRKIREILGFSENFIPINASVLSVERQKELDNLRFLKINMYEKQKLENRKSNKRN